MSVVGRVTHKHTAANDDFISLSHFSNVCEVQYRLVPIHLIHLIDLNIDRSQSTYCISMSHISISVVVVESFRPFSAEKKERRETSMYIASYIESKKKKSICIHDARPKSTKSPIYQKLFFDHNTPEDDDERREKYY